MLKYFEQDVYDQYDTKAKSAAQKFWRSIGYGCIENPDLFGVDLLVEGKNKSFGCEVEVKLGWHGPEFPFPSLRLPYRKKKFTDSPCHFFVLNQSMTHAALISRRSVLASPVEIVSNVKVPSGEKFYIVSNQAIQLVNLLAKPPK